MQVNIQHAIGVYTLINSSWGTLGVNVGSITFNASGGLTYSVSLVEGYNVRDYYFGGYVNYTTDPSTTQSVWGLNSSGHSHLDMQTFTLPANFQNATLTSIVFKSLGGNPAGIPFLAGVTVSAVPEPSTVIAGALVLVPFGVSALRILRKNRAN